MTSSSCRGTTSWITRSPYATAGAGRYTEATTSLKGGTGKNTAQGKTCPSGFIHTILNTVCCRKRSFTRWGSSRCFDSSNVFRVGFHHMAALFTCAHFLAAIKLPETGQEVLFNVIEGEIGVV